MVSAPSMDVAQCLTDVSSYKKELATIWLVLSPLSAFRYLVLRRSFCLGSLLLLKWQLTFWNVLTSAHRICGAQREWPPSSRLNHNSPITTSPLSTRCPSKWSGQGKRRKHSPKKQDTTWLLPGRQTLMAFRRLLHQQERHVTNSQYVIVDRFLTTLYKCVCLIEI